MLVDLKQMFGVNVVNGGLLVQTLELATDIKPDIKRFLKQVWKKLNFSKMTILFHTMVYMRKEEESAYRPGMD